jgi:hypothetical protein
MRVVHTKPVQGRSEPERFQRATLTIKNMYTYHCLVHILIPTLRILVLQDVSLWKPQILQLLLF